MQNSRILFITDKYLPFPSSNGACISRIVNSYENKENIFVISFSEEANENTSNVYYCRYKRNPSSFFNRLFGYCQDNAAVNALFVDANRMVEENNINKVVCVYRSIECLLAGLKLKKKHRDLCVIGYFLDNIFEWSTSSKLKDQIFYINQKRLLNQLNHYFDSIIALKYYKPTIKKMLTRSTKVDYVGLPSLQDRKIESSLFNKSNINIVYAGSFYSNCRRPDEILEFLNCVHKQLPQLKIYLFSWGCEDLIDAAKEKMRDCLEVCGRVSLEEADRAIQSADILLNVGNDLPYAIPGKLIEYFSTGKSIINFSYRHGDGAAADCEKYENIFNVYANSENNVDDCVRFILNRHTLPWDVLHKKFYDSTPEYTATKILETGLNKNNV